MLEAHRDIVVHGMHKNEILGVEGLLFARTNGRAKGENAKEREQQKGLLGDAWF